jgi:hypothetical protein
MINKRPRWEIVQKTEKHTGILLGSPKTTPPQQQYQTTKDGCPKEDITHQHPDVLPSDHQCAPTLICVAE